MYFGEQFGVPKRIADEFGEACSMHGLFIFSSDNFYSTILQVLVVILKKLPVGER